MGIPYRNRERNAKGRKTGGENMKQIMIIDDDAYIGDMLEEVLAKEGYEAIRAYSGTA